MTVLKKYNLQGEEIGVVEISERLVETPSNPQLIKDVIVALNANQRQWTACTKTRAEVKHTTKKPHKQKGTGRARQGSLVTSQFRGGGIVFGPKPKFGVYNHINKKQKRGAIKIILAERIRAGQVILLDSMHMEAPSTKTLASFMQKTGLTKRVLFLAEAVKETITLEDSEKEISVASSAHTPFAKSVRNLEKVEFSLCQNISGLDIAKAKNVVMTEETLAQMTEWLNLGEDNG